MNVALLVDDPVAGELVGALLARVEVRARVLRRPRPGVDADALIAALRAGFDEIIAVGAPSIPGTRALVIEPSLEAWLTRDAAANREVLGTDEVPAPERAQAWLRGLSLAGGRRYSGTIDGRALADHLDLTAVMAEAPALRALVAGLRPAWATVGSLKRGRGRPPGVQLFQGSGYALCLELLHRGAGAEVTTGELVVALGRTKTPVLRMVTEAERRGFIRRTSLRGPVRVRDTDRLLDDLVTSVRAERARTPPPVRQLRSDRDPARLAERVAGALAEVGIVLAVTGAAAVPELGGDLLIGAPVRAYATLAALGTRPLADAFPTPRDPQLVIIEPPSDAVYHGLRPGTPARVSSWQAVVDLLASDSEREREIGSQVRRRLLEPR